MWFQVSFILIIYSTQTNIMSLFWNKIVLWLEIVIFIRRWPEDDPFCLEIVFFDTKLFCFTGNCFFWLEIVFLTRNWFFDSKLLFGLEIVFLTRNCFFDSNFFFDSNLLFWLEIVFLTQNFVLTEIIFKTYSFLKTFKN
jgi:hypothetical protein